MSILKFEIDQEDIAALQAATFCASGNLTLAQFERQCKEDYTKYAKGRENPKTFSQWVNGQTIAMTSPW